MATWQDVTDCAAALPELEQRPGERSWRVRGKPVAWERPLRRADLEHLGAAAPDGPILGVRVPDLDTKDVRLTELAPAVFVTPHFDGYPAVLVDLPALDVEDLADLIEDAWAAQAPKRVVKQWRDSAQGGAQPDT
jgi:hypothetical protein